MVKFLFNLHDMIYVFIIVAFWFIFYIFLFFIHYRFDSTVAKLKEEGKSDLAPPMMNQQTSISIDGSDNYTTKDDEKKKDIDTSSFDCKFTCPKLTLTKQTKQRILISFLILLFIGFSIYDRLAFGVLANDDEYLKQFGFTVLVVIISLLFEFILNKGLSMPFNVTACVRDVINNITLIIAFILTYIGSNIAFNNKIIYWTYDYWVPIMWGCYITDLIMILLFWNGFPKSWRIFVIFHHCLTGSAISVINHVNSNNNFSIEEFDWFWPTFGVFIYFQSNTFGVLPEIFKYYKLFEKQTHIVVPMFYLMQRFCRLTGYICGITIPWYHRYYNYGLLLVFGALLDLFDHFIISTRLLARCLRNS